MNLEVIDLCVMDITKVHVYGLSESILASGYPKGNNNINHGRAQRLGSCKSGTGHDCYLKGFIVQADINAPQYWWLQWGRYHFSDIVSSESKMHTILEMNISKQCNDYVTDEAIVNLENCIQAYKDNPSQYNFQVVVSNCPSGLRLKARTTMNYLQLKTMYLQRKHHRLREWDIFCTWMERLPDFIALTQPSTEKYHGQE